MVTKTLGLQPGHYLVSEANKTRSRATIVVAAGHVLEPGTVLALNAGSGQYIPYANDGTTPGQAARAILFGKVDSTEGPVTAVATVRDSEVHGDEIVFLGSEDTGDKEAAYADLATHGIIMRFETRVT